MLQPFGHACTAEAYEHTPPAHVPFGANVWREPPTHFEAGGVEQVTFPHEEVEPPSVACEASCVAASPADMSPADASPTEASPSA